MKKLKILMIAFLVIMSVSIFCSEMDNLRIANFRDMKFLSMEVLEKIEPDRVGEYVKDYQPVPGAAGRDYYLMKVRMKNNTALNSYFYPDSLWVDSEDTVLCDAMDAQLTERGQAEQYGYKIPAGEQMAVRFVLSVEKGTKSVYLEEQPEISVNLTEFLQDEESKE